MMNNPDTHHGLKHVPFFAACGREEQDSPRSRIATAGLLVLRHIDFWVFVGMEMVAPECINVRSSRAAIMALPSGDAQQAVLLSIINMMQTSHEVDIVPLLPKLAEYAELLDREEWSTPLADDVRFTVTRLGNAQRDEDQAAAELLENLRQLLDEEDEPPASPM